MTSTDHAEAFQIVCWPGPAAIGEAVLGCIVWNKSLCNRDYDYDEVSFDQIFKKTIVC